MKSSGPRAFRPVVMTVVAVVVVLFFAAIIIATWSGDQCGRSLAEPLGAWSTWSMVDVVGARRSRSGRGRRGRSSAASRWGVVGGELLVVLVVVALSAQLIDRGDDVF